MTAFLPSKDSASRWVFSMSVVPTVKASRIGPMYFYLRMPAAVVVVLDTSVSFSC
jgi:hypothetical protein